MSAMGYDELERLLDETEEVVEELERTGDDKVRRRCGELLCRLCTPRMALAMLALRRAYVDELERLRVQLAGIDVAADGGAVGENDARDGDYGWSPAFEKVKRLRAAYDELQGDRT